MSKHCNKTGSFLLRKQQFSLEVTSQRSRKSSSCLHSRRTIQKKRIKKRKSHQHEVQTLCQSRNTVLLYQISCDAAGRRRRGRSTCLKTRNACTSTRSHDENSDYRQMQHTHAFYTICPSFRLLTSQPPNLLIELKDGEVCNNVLVSCINPPCLRAVLQQALPL